MNPRSHQPQRYLFATWEGGGNIAPVICVARQLLARGHHVRFMSDHATRADAEAAGLEFVPWQTAPSRTDRSPASCPVRDWEAANPQEGILRLMDRLLYGAALDYARDVIAELERAPADLVVASEMLPGVMAACESRGQRFALLAANLCVYPLPEMPAFGPGLPPPRDEDEAAMHEQIKQATAQIFDQGLDHLNRARLALGLLPLQSAMEQIHPADRYLLATSRAFDFPVQQLPEMICYVGPQLEEAADAEAWSPPWSADDTRPLIAVGFSTTFQNHATVLQKVVDALAALPVRALVTLGQISPDAVCPAANTVLLPSAPHDAVMRAAALVITHGGHGTVMRALKHQLPMLIIPHGRDQDENAIRVTERGAGLRLHASAGVEAIRSAVQQLLQEPSFTCAAKQLSNAIAGEERDESVLHLLEELASKAPAALSFAS